MNEATNSLTTRREFLKNTSRIAAASALAGTALPYVHAAENNTIQVALIGCGGRGSGAAVNALNVKNGPLKLVAMADVFKQRLDGSYDALKRNQVGKLVDVPEDRKFVGFDAYRKAMDCLKPGDIAIFASPPAFRWVHFTYAIAKGLNVFMEKPVTVDGPTSRRMLQLGEESVKKNLKVGVGLMSRHSRALQELAQRIQDGEIGDIILMRGYRMHGPIGFFSSLPKPPGVSELMSRCRLSQFPLGQRRELQRLLHPHHRPPRLDEERLAGQGPGAGRPPLSPEPRRCHLRGPESRYVCRGIHL